MILSNTKSSKKVQASTVTFKDFLQRTHYKSFFIQPVTEHEVEKELSKIDLTKSTGINDLNLRVICQIAPLIKQPLTSIFNKLFPTGKFPDKLKISLITPIFKNDNNQLFSNCYNRSFYG